MKTLVKLLMMMGVAAISFHWVSVASAQLDYDTYYEYGYDDLLGYDDVYDYDYYYGYDDEEAFAYDDDYGYDYYGYGYDFDYDDYPYAYDYGYDYYPDFADDDVLDWYADYYGDEFYDYDYYNDWYDRSWYDDDLYADDVYDAGVYDLPDDETDIEYDYDYDIDVDRPARRARRPQARDAQRRRQDARRAQQAAPRDRQRRAEQPRRPRRDDQRRADQRRADQRRADQRRADQRPAGQQQPDRRRARRGAPRVRQLRGTLADIRRIVPPGVDEQYIAALLETQDGNRMPATLGAASKTEQLDLSEGTQVQLTGHVISPRGRPLFIAHRIQANDQTVALDHRQMRQRGLRAVSGQIVGRRQIQLPGVDEPMTAALIESERGTRIAANLGATNKLNELNLEQGDQVRVTGHITQIHDNPVLIAHRVQAGEQEVEVDHQSTPIRQPSETRKMSGKLLETRSVQPPGLPSMVVARVDTIAGELVTNLGAADKVDQLDLQQGDQLQVWGHEIQLHGKTVFIAHEIKKGDQRVALDHQSLRLSRTRSISGTIQRMKEIQPPGEAPQMIAVQIRKADGTRVSANLGPVDKLNQLGLSEGDEVSLTGRFVQIHDMPVFMPYVVRSGGQQVSLVDRRAVGFRGDRRQDDQRQRRQDDQRQRRQDVQRQRRQDVQRQPARRAPRRRPPQQTERPGGLGVLLGNNADIPGAEVLAIDRGSVAARAGLRPGDRLMTIGDNYVTTGNEAAEIIARHEPGEQVRLLLRRDGRQIATTVELTSRMQALDSGLEYDDDFYELDFDPLEIE